MELVCKSSGEGLTALYRKKYCITTPQFIKTG